MPPPTQDLSDKVIAAIVNPSIRARHIGLAKGIVGEADAEDIVQRAYMKAYSKKHNFSGSSSPETWLYRIIVNTALNHKRKKSRYKEGPIYDNTEFSSQNPGPDVICIARDELEQVFDQMETTITPIAQEGIMMAIRSDVFGCSYRDLSSEYGIPEGTVGWRMSDSRQRARDIRDRMSPNH